MQPKVSTAGADDDLVRRIEELKRERDEAHRREAATAEVLKAMSRSTFNLQDVLDSLVKSAVQLTGAETVAITRPDGEVYRIAAVYDPDLERSEAAKQNPVLKDRQSATGRAVLERRIIHIHDVLDDPEYTWAGRQTAGARTILAVPMLREDIVVGVIGCVNHEVRPFTAKQIELVQTFADQAVIAIENTRLFEAEQASKRELQKSLEQQTATGEILTSISTSMADPQPVFDAILRNASRLLGTQRCNVVLLRDGILHMPAAAGELLPRRFPRPLDHTTAVGQAILTKQVVQYSPVLGEGSAAPSATQSFAREIGHNSVLNVPMLHKDEVIGAIGAARREAKAFDDKQVALIKAFADQAVIAIENARLFEEVQARTRELTQSLEQQTATSEVLGVISSSQGVLQPVFETMLSNAVRICEAKFGNLLLYEGDKFRFVAMHGASLAFAELRQRSPMIHPSNGPLARIVATKQLQHVADFTMEQTYLDRNPTAVELADTAGARTLLGVPMLKDNKLLGVIVIYRQEVRPFTDKQIELVKSFANQAVIAIENTRLLNELRESLQQQTATADVLKVISRATFDLPRVLDTLVESAATLCDSFDTAIVQKDGDVMRIVSHRGKIPSIGPVGQATLPLTRAATVGCAVLDRQTIHIADLQSETDKYPEGSVIAKQLAFRTILTVPLLAGSQAIGAITLRRSEVRPFTDRQIELLQTFADGADANEGAAGVTRPANGHQRSARGDFALTQRGATGLGYDRGDGSEAVPGRACHHLAIRGRDISRRGTPRPA